MSCLLARVLSCLLARSIAHLLACLLVEILLGVREALAMISFGFFRDCSRKIKIVKLHKKETVCQEGSACQEMAGDGCLWRTLLGQTQILRRQ